MRLPRASGVVAVGQRLERGDKPRLAGRAQIDAGGVAVLLGGGVELLR